MGLFWDADPSSHRQLDGDVFVELDVGSEGNGDEAQLGGVLRDLVADGSIASYLTSPQGFQFRRLGAGEPGGGFAGSLRGFWGALERFGEGVGAQSTHIPTRAAPGALPSWRVLSDLGGGVFGVLP